MASIQCILMWRNLQFVMVLPSQIIRIKKKKIKFLVYFNLIKTFECYHLIAIFLLEIEYFLAYYIYRLSCCSHARWYKIVRCSYWLMTYLSNYHNILTALTNKFIIVRYHSILCISMIKMQYIWKYIVIGQLQLNLFC